MLLLYVFCVLSWLGTPQACMPSTRLTSYMPTIYWWHSNVTALNQTRPQLQNLTVQQQELNKTFLATDVPTINPQATSDTPVTPELLPIQPSVDHPHRTMYTRVIASPEIPMPKPAFVTPYKPPPILIPPTTEDPNVLWDKVLGPRHPSKLHSKDHDPTEKWWVRIAVKQTPRPSSQAHIREPTIVQVPVADPNEIVSVDSSKILSAIQPGHVVDATTTEDDLMSESSEVQDELEQTELVDPTTVVSDPIDAPKQIDLKNVMSVESSTQHNNNKTHTSDVDGSDETTSVNTETSPAAEETNAEEGISAEGVSVESGSTQASAAEDIATTTQSATESATSDPTTTEWSPPATIATQGTTATTTTTTTENIREQDSEPSDEQVIEPENVTSDSSTSTSTERAATELKTTTIRSPTPKRTKFERPFNAHEEIVTQHSRIPNSFIHTMPPNSVILIVEDPNDKEEIINALKATGSGEKSGNTPEKMEPLRETASGDVTNTTERLDVPTTVLQISNDTYRLSSDLLNVTQSVTDAVTQQMMTEATTAAPVTVDSSAADTTPFTVEAAVTPAVVAPVVRAADAAANNATSLAVDTFQGSVIDASSTESMRDAIDVAESPTRTRIVNEEDVLLERIPHSAPAGGESKEREDAMQSDSIISSVMEIINASSKSEARRTASDVAVTQARTRKLSNADISYRIDWQVEPETTWLAEGVLLPNGTSVIVPKEGIRGVPAVLPLPPPPTGVAMQTTKIQMRRQRLIDGKKILVATIPQENPRNPPLVYYYWKEPRTRRYVLVNE